MRDRWSVGPIYTSRCGCGVRLIASDSVELERRRGSRGIRDETG